MKNRGMSDDVPEIEVTPEMIEAGTLQLARFNSDFDTPEDAVRWIYEAMVEAKQTSIKK